MTYRNTLRRTSVLAAALVLALGAGLSVRAQSTLDAPRKVDDPTRQTTADRTEQRTQQRQAQTGPAALDTLAREYPDLSAFTRALAIAGLDKTLTDGSEYTVFAPTNDALAEKRGKNFDELLEPQNREELTAFLQAHIVSEPIDLQSPRDLPEIKTIDGEKIAIDRKEGTAKVDGAKVVNLNGIDVGHVKIYAIDDVLSKKGKSTPDAQVSNRDSRAAPR